MTNEQPAKITKAYARGLIAFVCVFVVALLVASWGLLGLSISKMPVFSQVATFTAPLLVAVAVGILAWIMWAQTISILRGNKPAWSLVIVASGSGYLVWCLGGVLANLTVEETWLSPFVLVIVLVWPIGLMLFWWLILRKLYSGRSTPKWPWEDKDEQDRRDL